MSADKAPTPIWVGVTQPGHFPSPYNGLWGSLKPPGGDSSGKGGSACMGMGWGEHGPAQTCPRLWVGQVAEQGAKVWGLLRV